jgi:hypothetical protein
MRSAHYPCILKGIGFIKFAEERRSIDRDPVCLNRIAQGRCSRLRLIQSRKARKNKIIKIRKVKRMPASFLFPINFFVAFKYDGFVKSRHSRAGGNPD